jgi:hypothetical protein
VLAPGALGLLTARIEAGGGLLTLGGYHAYGAGGYAHTPLADVLPFLVSDGDGQRETALRLGLTPEGRVHPILSGLERELTSGRPPALEGLTRVGRAKPGAQVLLTGPGEEGRPPDIVLAAQRYGKGRVVSFTGDTSWRWFRSPEYGGPDGLYGRLWGQTIRWLLEREPEVEKTGDPVVLFTDRPVYRIGETVRIRARVSGPDGTPVSDATVEVRRTGPGGEERLALSPLPRVPGHYEVRVRAMRAGESGLAATASRNGSEIGTATGSYRVEDASIEMDNVDLDEDRLGAIAAASGGRYYHSPPTAEAVARDIRGTLAGLRRREETRLVNAPLFFLLFVLLTGGEWALRKRRNLL